MSALQSPGDPDLLAAVVLAAGLSRRMGVPKLLLPWGQTTVIGRVIQVLQTASLPEIVVVTGAEHAQIEAALQGSLARSVINPGYAQDDMVQSLAVGLRALPAGVEAALVTLGDQPQIEPQVVRAVIEAYRQERAPLVVPSYQMRRGHPWLVQRSLWPELLALEPGQTFRDFLDRHAGEICYRTVETASILSDLDTPEDYQRQHP